MRISRLRAICYGAIVGAVGIVAGCSGGGGSVAPTVPGATLTPNPGSTTYKQSATAIITFPHGKVSELRRRNYVSPGSTSISVIINLVNGQTPPSWVPTQPVVEPLLFAGTGQNCTVNNGVATCAITIPAPPGNVDYSIATYEVVPPTAGPYPTGTATPTPVPSGTGAPQILDFGEETIAIKQGVANQITVTLEGVAQSAVVSLATPLVEDVASTANLNFTAYDAGGYAITGTKPFDSPFKLVDGDRYGPNNPDLYPYSTFLLNGAQPQGKQIQVLTPADVVQIKYGGVGLPSFNILAEGKGKDGAFALTAGTITPVLQPIVLPGTFVDNAANGGQPTDPNYNQNTLLVPVGQTVSITPSEAGFTNSPPFGLCSPIPNDYQCLPLADVANVSTPPCNDGPQFGFPEYAAFSPPPPNGQTRGYTYTVQGLQAGLCIQQFYDGLIPGHDPAPIGNPLVNGEIWVKVQ
jgi:hypothetical protein